MPAFANRSLFAYAWDIADGDPAARLSDIAALGIDTVSLAMSYHDGKFIRPRSEGSKVVFPEDGTVYFAPDESRYGAIKPRVSSLVTKQDLAANWPKIAGRTGLRLNAWTVLLHNTVLGRANPDCAVRNVYGDPYWYSLEPCHPDVAAYAVTLATDIASRESIGGLSLETPGYLPYVHGYHHEFQQVVLDPRAEVLLGLSFHPEAMKAAKAAGISIDKVRDGVKRRLDAWMDGAPPIPPDMAIHALLADIIDDRDLCDFLRWRGEPVTDIIRRIRAGMPQGKRLSVIASVQRPSAFAWLEGTDFRALADIADRFELCLYEPNTDRVAADLFDMIGRIGDVAKIAAILRPGPPDLSGGIEISAALAHVSGAGVKEIGLYNYGMLRRANLEGLKQALAKERG